jgi:hypothetical protein
VLPTIKWELFNFNTQKEEEGGGGGGVGREVDGGEEEEEDTECKGGEAKE